MTFIRKHSGDLTRPIVAVYTCPEHGQFDAEVVRDENGEAPDEIKCGLAMSWMYTPEGNVPLDEPCACRATWTPSPTVSCRVRRIEAVKGRWEAPERKTYLDTRDLAEGMDEDDWQAKRAAVWEERRKEEVMQIKKGGGW